MNHIEFSTVRIKKRERVLLHEFEWIVRLRSDVHSDDLIETRSVITHRRTARAAEQIKQSHKPSSFARAIPFPIRICLPYSASHSST